MPAPVQEIKEDLFDKKGVRLFIKREDLNHPIVSGNKWRKLKYNLEEAKRLGHSQLLTFGGAYSNHIYAVAGAGKAYGYETVGIIRGEETLPLNETLTFAQSCGMQFHYTDRSTYRNKNTDIVKETLLKEFGHCYIIPEGGTNKLAIQGCTEIVDDLDRVYDHYCLSVGTGGTIAGIIEGLDGKAHVLGFSSLKGSFLYAEVEKLLEDYSGKSYSNWEINNDFHFGGYAKIKPELTAFITRFEDSHKIPIEPIYTAKALFGIYELIHSGYFKKGSDILFIHTGGIQGRSGFDL